MASACIVCADPFNEGARRAVVLPCLHTVCQQCVGDMVQQSLLRDLTWPMCRECGEPFDPEALTTDVVAMAALAASSSSSSSAAAAAAAAAAPWASSASASASASASSAAAAAAAKQPDYQLPPLLPATTRTAATTTATTATAAKDPAQLCASHRQNLLFYCETCNKPLCGTCRSETIHLQHAVSDIDKLAVQREEELRKRMAKLSDVKVPALRDAAAHLHNMSRDVEQQVVLLQREIDTEFDGVVADLTERLAALQTRITEVNAQRDKLKTKVKDELDVDLKTIQLQMQTVELSQSHIEVSQQQANKLAAASASLPAVARIQQATTVLSRIAALEAEDASTRSLVQNNLRFYFTKPPEPFAPPAEKLGALRRYGDFRHVGVPTKVFGAYNGPLHIAQLTTGNLAVSDFTNKCVVMVTTMGEPVTNIKMDAHTYGIVGTKDGGFWVSKFNKNAVERYNFGGMAVKSLEVTKPWRLALAPNDTLLVGCYDRQCVEAYTDKGVKLWSSNGSGLGLVLGVAASATEVFVCDRNNNRIQVLSLANGAFLRHLAAGQLHAPTGIAVIPNTENLIVAERDCASVWNTHGELQHRWGSEGSRPGQFNSGNGDVAVLSDGRIAVTDKRIQIF